MDKQERLKQLVEEANKTYRLTGENSGLTDEEYDYLLSLVDDEDFRSRVGVEIEKSKVELSVTMGSLNKVKSQEELLAWCKSKKIPAATALTISPKFDGLSLLVEYEHGQFKSAATRGDGYEGQDVTEHFRYTRLGRNKIDETFTGFIVGETIMADHIFEEKYSKKFKNPRNMVAGLLSRKQVSEELQDVHFIAFSVHGKDFATTADELAFCNAQINWIFHYQLAPKTQPMAELSDDILHEAFARETVYQCDGLVLEVDNHATQAELGNETNSLNPAFARAWKPESDDSRSSMVVNVNWQVSKSGRQKPVVQIEAVDLGGVTISNVTGINARFMADNNIAEGAVVSIIRSGDVIPKIIKVLLPADGASVPTQCACCESDLVWNETEIELICENLDCAERVISQNTDFFKILEIDEVGEGIVRQFYEAGHKTPQAILALNALEICQLEGFQEKKAAKVHKSIQQKLKDIPLAKLQHASNLFRGLGSRKLEALAQFDAPEKKPTALEIVAIDGFSDITAKAYLEGIDAFWSWASELPVTIKAYKVLGEGPLKDKNFVFSGFRSKELEAEIVEKGGKVTSSVSKKTFALVMKRTGTGSSKEKKALDAGAQVMTVEELESFLSEV